MKNLINFIIGFWGKLSFNKFYFDYLIYIMELKNVFSRYFLIINQKLYKHSIKAKLYLYLGGLLYKNGKGKTTH